MGARRNIPTKKQRQRQQAVAAGREPPSQAEVRFSVRRSAQVANYNEEEDEDEFVEDDDDMTPNYWATAPGVHHKSQLDRASARQATRRKTI